MTDSFISFHECVQLFSQVVVLDPKDSNVVIQSIDLSLKAGVVVQKSRITVSGSLVLLPHLHDLILSDSNFILGIFDRITKLVVSATLLIDSSL